MNGLIAVLLILSAAGLLDQLLGGRLGLADSFDRGVTAMGGLAISLVGIYCLGITAVQQHANILAQLGDVLPFDPSVLVGSLLAPDLGGWSMASGVALSDAMGRFSGVIVSSTLGCAVSFVLPLSLAAIEPKETEDMMRGLLLGIVTLPAALVSGGWLLKVPLGELLRSCAPIILLCGLLCLALWKATTMTTRILLVLGNGVRGLSFFLFALVVFGLFSPNYALVQPKLVQESLVIVLKITAVVCGAMVLSRLILARCTGPIRRVACWLGVNERAVVGLLLSLASSLSMLPLFSKMDRRGKAMNAAFSVCGAFSLGGATGFYC